MTDRDLTPDEIEALKKVNDLCDETEQAFAQAIGLFAMRFAELEFSMNLAIGDFLRLPTTSMTLMLTSAIRSVTTRVHILSSLTHGSRMSDTLRNQLIECIKEIEDLNAYRNWLLHDPFHLGMLNQDRTVTPDEREWKKIRARTESRFKFQTKEFTVPQILEKAKLCGPLSTRITTLVHRYRGERHEHDS